MALFVKDWLRTFTVQCFLYFTIFNVLLVIIFSWSNFIGISIFHYDLMRFMSNLHWILLFEAPFVFLLAFLTIPVPKSDATKRGESFLNHIIFIDVVGYSARKLGQQYEIVMSLTGIIRRALEAYSLAIPDDCIVLPTGDGFALCLRPSVKIDDIPKIAVMINRLPKEGAISFLLRMGVDRAFDLLYSDINGNHNVVGGGINMAARIQGEALPGQILISREIYNELVLREEFSSQLVPIGNRKIKHEVEMDMYELITPRFDDATADGSKYVQDESYFSYFSLPQQSSDRNKIGLVSKFPPRVPFRLFFIARTDSTNIRFEVLEQVRFILNWEEDRKRLRVDQLRPMMNMMDIEITPLSPDVWHAIDVYVKTERVELIVDGKLLAMVDIRELNSSVEEYCRVYSTHNAKVDVIAFNLVSLK